jgi:hypothetical protein
MRETTMSQDPVCAAAAEIEAYHRAVMECFGLVCALLNAIEDKPAAFGKYWLYLADRARGAHSIAIQKRFVLNDALGRPFRTHLSQLWKHIEVVDMLEGIVKLVDGAVSPLARKGLPDPKLVSVAVMKALRILKPITAELEKETKAVLDEEVVLLMTGSTARNWPVIPKHTLDHEHSPTHAGDKATANGNGNGKSKKNEKMQCRKPEDLIAVRKAIERGKKKQLNMKDSVREFVENKGSAADIEKEVERLLRLERNHRERATTIR